MEEINKIDSNKARRIVQTNCVKNFKKVGFDDAKIVRIDKPNKGNNSWTVVVKFFVEVSQRTLESRTMCREFLVDKDSGDYTTGDTYICEEYAE